MKGTIHFKKAIEIKLQEMAQNDEAFKRSLENKDKNIDDCIQYILNTVKKSGINGFTDDEVYGMAAHYYDEDKIDIGGKISCEVVVNHTVELTEKEKREAHEKAMEMEIEKQREKITAKKKKKAKKESVTEQTLF